MNDYSEQITIPSDFFAKTLKEYQDWRFAWFRETVQNSADAGASKIDFSIESVDVDDGNSIQLTVTDNGCGMDMTTLREGFLTLGGSIKSESTNKQAIGGYGYAKHIILFAHQHYQIKTKQLMVSGEGSQYVIEPVESSLAGTQITVKLANTGSLAVLLRKCRLLVQHYQTDIQFTLNGKMLNSQSEDYEYHIGTDLGHLQFSEEDDSDVMLWIRMQGLPMFQYYLMSSGQKGFSGTLDLTGEPTELLTANRDGLNFKFSSQLNHLLYELINQRQQFKQKNQLNLVFNASYSELKSSALPQELTHINKSDTPFATLFNEQEQQYQQQVNLAIEQLQALSLIATYPDNFHLHVSHVVLRKEKGKHAITMADIKYSLNLHRVRKLAWCWLTAVRWVLETEYLKFYFRIEYEQDKDRYSTTHNAEPAIPIDVGFVFDGDVEGLNVRTEQGIKILLSPYRFQSDWLMGDLLDIAIHECAHCLETGHGELFSQVEMQIRKDLRRMISERQVLQEAKEALQEVLSESQE